MTSKPDLMVTHTPDGASYGTLSGKPVTERRARDLTGDLFVRPAEDGLFPGFTQTWLTVGKRKEGTK